MTRNHISSVIRSALPQAANINTRWISGAYVAAFAGIEDSSIQILGQGIGDPFCQYLHLSDDFILRICRTLPSWWDTD